MTKTQLSITVSMLETELKEKVAKIAELEAHLTSNADVIDGLVAGRHLVANDNVEMDALTDNMRYAAGILK